VHAGGDDRSPLAGLSGVDNNKTSGQSNLTTGCTRTVQRYLPGGASMHHHLIHDSLHPSESISQTVPRTVHRFCTAHWYTLQWAAPPPPIKIAPSHEWIWTYNTQFPAPTSFLNPNGISVGSANFAGLTSVMDRLIDRPRYLVGNDRPHLCTYYIVLRCGLKSNSILHKTFVTVRRRCM